MPTYDYVCRSCGHSFELFQSITAPIKRKCPSCAKNGLQRLIGTGAGVLFKGSGFYETDYRSDSYRKAAEAEKKATEPKKDAKEAAPCGSGCACAPTVNRTVKLADGKSKAKRSKSQGSDKAAKD